MDRAVRAFSARRFERLVSIRPGPTLLASHITTA
jgi:hypothetical protein